MTEYRERRVSEPNLQAGSLARKPVGRARAFRTMLILSAVAGAGMFLFVPTERHRVSHRALAQSQSATRPPDPPGTIDGSKNPELIPDNVAYKTLFLSLIEPRDPTEAQKARQRAKIARIRLDESDGRALLGLVAQFREHRAAIDAQVAEIHKRNPVPHPASTDWQELAALQKQKEELVSDTIAALPHTLTSDGLSKLEADLATLKRGIKMVPRQTPAIY